MTILLITTRTPRFRGPNLFLAERYAKTGKRLRSFDGRAISGQKIDVLLWRNPNFWANRGGGIWAPEKIQKNLLDDGM